MGPGDGGGASGSQDGGDHSVVVVTQQYPPDRSGHASRMADIATGLADRGWDVTVLAAPPAFPHGEFDRSWRRAERTDDGGVDVRRLWSWQPAGADPGMGSRLAYYVTFALHALGWLLTHRGSYDVAVTTTPPVTTGLAGFGVLVSGRPWVVDVRDLWIDAAVSLGFIAEGGILERFGRRFQRAVLAQADRVGVTTPTLGDTLAGEYGRGLADKTFHAPTGFDPDRFHQDVRGDGGAGKPVVVYVGNIGYAQVLDQCVRAMTRLPDEVELHLVGGGDRVAELEELVGSLDLTDRVEFHGPVARERIPEILATAAVGLAPLDGDAGLDYAMPTKVYEYLGSGVPALVTGSGEIVRFVEASGGGVHVEDDPDAIATALAGLLGDQGRRSELGRRGREYVHGRYTRDRVVGEYHDQLRALVGES